MELDAFEYRDPEGVSWPLQNILASFGPPGGDQRLLLVAHWDTRPWADMDPDPGLRGNPVPGANDGASGVAILLEVARVIGSLSLPQGVDILFADGEDLGQPGSNDGYCQGTRRFAGRNLSRYACAVVLDMVGDADLRLPVERYSLARAPEVLDWVWKHGMAVAPGVFVLDVGSAVYDDHMPLLAAGLPAVDIIDFEYPAWHTQRDDLTAISKESLATVGRVVLNLLLDPAPRPGGG